MERIFITLPDPLTKQFYAKIEKGRRSQFITQALEEALNKEGKWQAFLALKNFEPFKVSQNSTKVLRKDRQSLRRSLKFPLKTSKVGSMNSAIRVFQEIK